MTEAGAAPYGWKFWTGVAVGWGLIAVGIRGLLVNANQTHPPDWAVWFIGSNLVHDLLFAPAVVFGGFAVGRLMPAALRRHVSAALIVSGVLALIGYPLVRGYGERPLNDSHLPRDYLSGLLVLLALVWIVAAVWAAVTLFRSAQRRDGELAHTAREGNLGPEAQS